MIKKIILASTFSLFATIMMAQSFNIGVRAGLNYSTFRGPLEKSINEDYGVSSGFHFGLNYAQNLSDLFSIRLEVLYVQNGAKQSFGGEGTESFYKIPIPSGEDVLEKGQLDYDLDISNAYISFPLTAHFNITDKIEVNAGAYVSMLIGPTATGLQEFESSQDSTNIRFVQSLEYNYNSDVAGEGQIIGRSPGIKVDGVIVYLPKFAGAYYQFNEKKANAINFLDYGLILGMSYNINRGFYVGIRADIGLADITNNDTDISRSELGENDTYVYRNDKDTHFGIQASFGFKF